MSSILLTTVRALGAWERGESSGDYSVFRMMLSPHFRLFCHPAPPHGGQGVHCGPNARAALEMVMRTRELRPPELTYSNVIILENSDTTVALFDVSSCRSQSERFASQAAMAFLIDRQGVAGFREYVGGGRFGPMT